MEEVWIGILTTLLILAVASWVALVEWRIRELEISEKVLMQTLSRFMLSFDPSRKGKQ